MRPCSAIGIALLVVGTVAISLSQYSNGVAQAKAGWVTLFDGKNLDNWSPIGTANWKLDRGALVADNGNGFMVSKTDYADFDLRVEFWIEAKTNSGVFIRCTDPNSVSGKTAYEVNIWDTRPVQKYGTGAIVDVAAVDPMPHAAGKWNTYEIIAKGGHVHGDPQRPEDRQQCPFRQIRQGAHRAPARQGSGRRKRRREVPQSGNQTPVGVTRQTLCTSGHLGDDRTRIGGRGLAGPGDVAVRPHQDQLRLIGGAAIRIGVADDLQRHAERLGGFGETRNAPIVAVERQQGEIRARVLRTRCGPS